MKTMHCVVKTATGAGHVQLASRPVPVPGPSDVLVRVLATAVCGTDVHIEDWNDWAARRVPPPVIIGHEFVGEVVELGAQVAHLAVGDLVAAETHIVCNHCPLCRSGNAHVCTNTKVLGVHRDGSFAEYLAFPAENAVLCDPALPLGVLAMMEPLGAAVHGAMAFPLAGKNVAVTGCGPIGLMALAAAKRMGAALVLAVEPNAMRAEMALRMGAQQVINPLEDEPVQAVREATGGAGVDVVLEYSGNIPAVQAALKYLRPEGQMAAVGLPGKPLAMDFAEFVYRGLTLRGIAGRRMYETWAQAAGLLRAGLDISPVITHELPLDDCMDALRVMRAGECGKIILKP